MITQKVILRTDIPKKDGTCLVCLQSFINKKRVVIPLGIYLRPSQFTKAKAEPGGLLDKKTAILYNRIIEDARARATDISTRYFLARRTLTPEGFKKEMLRHGSEDDFIKFIQDQLPMLSETRGKNTVLKYRDNPEQTCIIQGANPIKGPYIRGDPGLRYFLKKAKAQDQYQVYTP